MDHVPDPAPLALREADFVVFGGRRLIFRHPNNPGRLLKVIRPDRDRAARRIWRTGQFRVFQEEISEYLVLRARDPNAEPLVAPIHGLVETTLGLALEVGRIAGPDGGLAPTLDDLIRDGGVTPEMREGIDRLAARLAALHVVVSDFKAHNLVLLPNGRDFCVIDGLGEKVLLSLRKRSRLVWRLSLEQARRRLHARIATGRHRPLRDRARLPEGLRLADMAVTDAEQTP
ncbi:MAG: hypothetical protein JJT81_04445 [Rubellimicrobium sp.]|nr:hypothetical protein [Rubellimicrobium sp.]